jgi:hypothetical protein
VIQPQKDQKRFRPSYKPSVLANEVRVILACEVHPTSETEVLPALLDQAAVHGPLETALLDAGYFTESVLTATAERKIEVLCPEGRSWGEDWNKPSAKGFPKSHFQYDAEQDHYLCPHGQVMTPVHHYRGTVDHPAYVQYGTAACADCPLRSRCTEAKRGRTIKRYASDDAKDALRAKMTQPEVRARYRQRQAMVEPVFSQLRSRQGLNRFRRRGLKAVRVEFTLHALAYNLSRAVALGRFLLGGGAAGLSGWEGPISHELIRGLNYLRKVLERMGMSLAYSPG